MARQETTLAGAIPAAAGKPERADSSARTVMIVLLVVYIFNFLDRQIVTILAESIKRDLGLSDTQIGLMTGLAFALFYTVLGIPLARYADRQSTSRVRLISLSLAAWSAMTLLCGMAQNVTQLLLARIGVGIGEAGCTPAAHSLISDTVPPEKRSTAMATYGLGIPIGGMLGMVIGGVLADSYGWRVAFMAVGVPGLVLALVLPLMIREPRHGALGRAAELASPRISIPAGEALREIFGSRGFLLLAVAASFTAFLSYGKAVWATILFIRSFGLSAGETGLLFGVVLGAAGVLGTWLGGVLADRLRRRDRRHILSAPAIGMVIATPLMFFGYQSTDWRVAIALLTLPAVLNALYYGPTYSCVQGLVRPEARAMASAVMLFAQNLIGLGLGPLFFGMLSDALKPMAGDESVRWVLYGAAWLGLIPALFFWRASLRLNAELKSG